MKNYIDISIKSADKVLTKPDKIIKFLETNMPVEERKNNA